MMIISWGQGRPGSAEAQGLKGIIAMATKITLPKLGQTMEEGLIVEWNKNEGDPVNRGDVLFQLESDKAVLEVEARAKGVLRKILLEPGTKVPVGTVVGIVAAEDEDISEVLAEVEGGSAEPERGDGETQAAGAQAAGAEAAGAQEAGAQEVEEEPPVHAPGERIFSSPRARKLADEKGADLARIAGTGPNGRIIEKDVAAYLERQPAATPLARQMAAREGIALEELGAPGERVRAAQVTTAAEGARVAAVEPAAAPGETVPMTGVRAVIAQRMAASAHTTAAVTLQSVVDVTRFVELREELKAAYADELGFSIGYNDLLAVIVARCLREFPYMNVRLEEADGKAVIRHLEQVNLGLAVDSERGLLVPVIGDADTMGVKQLAVTFRELVDRARQGKALPDDLSGGTFTITNLGMFGTDMFTPIINLPETAILGVGRIRPEPVAVGNQVEIRQRMWLSLTFDHRLVDGAPAARFLQGIMRYIESPYLLLA
jgi:pyruvate dehydrogenase E2 component (dihydrolipoamide acetyltransferase)